MMTEVVCFRVKMYDEEVELFEILTQAHKV